VVKFDNDEESCFWKTAVIEIMKAQASHEDYAVNDSVKDVDDVCAYADKIVEEFRKRKELP
jgi:hypothetical protein